MVSLPLSQTCGLDDHLKWSVKVSQACYIGPHNWFHVSLASLATPACLQNVHRHSSWSVGSSPFKLTSNSIRAVCATKQSLHGLLQLLDSRSVGTAQIKGTIKRCAFLILAVLSNFGMVTWLSALTKEGWGDDL